MLYKQAHTKTLQNLTHSSILPTTLHLRRKNYQSIINILCANLLISNESKGQYRLNGEDCGIGANMVDCNIEESEFKLQSHYYIHFQTNKGISLKVNVIM